MYLNAQQLADALPWDALMGALSDIFTRPVNSLCVTTTKSKYQATPPPCCY